MLQPFGDLLIAGGWFTRIGVLEVPGIAAWDGVRWSRFGDFPGTDVIEIEPYGDGLLALGTAQWRGGLWEWRGGAWHALPDLPFGAGHGIDLAVDGSSVAVAVSQYDIDEAQWYAQVLVYENGQWTALGDRVGTTAQICWYRGELYAAGYNWVVGRISPVFVMRWDGDAWTQVGAGVPASGMGMVSDLVVHDDELIVGGSFAEGPDFSVMLSAARWNGARWDGMSEGGLERAHITRLRSRGGQLYAVGQIRIGEVDSGIARWDGAWHSGDDRFQSLVNDIADFGGALHAGGFLARNGTRAAPPFVRRAGDRWESPTEPDGTMQGFLGWSGPQVRTLLVDDQQVIAGGVFEFAGSPQGWRSCKGAALWSGGQWSSFGFESFRDAYTADLVRHQGALYAVGSFSPSNSWTTSVVRLAGGEWAPIEEYPTIVNVHAIASGQGRLLVGGSVSDGLPGVAEWDGARWRALGGGVTRGLWVSDIEVHGGDVVIAGRFEEVGGVACSNIAAWNPTTGWRALGRGTDQPVIALLSVGGDLYAAGQFSHAGEVTAWGVARWRSGAWEALALPRPDDPVPGITSLVWFEGMLVAAGEGLPNGIAALDQSGEWHPLGSGVNNVILSMAVRGSSLFVGGFFSRAGQMPAYGFSEWRVSRRGEPALAARVVATPNPSPGAVGLRFELARAAEVRLEIFDLAGKLVDRPFDGPQSAGEHELAWTPKGRTRPGVYFARLTAEGTTRVARIVRLP